MDLGGLSMRTKFSRLAAVAVVAVLAACGAEQSDELAVELESAAGAESQLLPRSEGIQFVSELEQNAPKVERAVAAPKPEARVSRAAPAEPKAQAEEAPPAPVPAEAVSQVQIEQPAPTPTVKPSVESAPRGVAIPQGETRRPPPGGWKTPSEVIRNAPFPINP
jgi:hypothetical protein